MATVSLQSLINPKDANTVKAELINLLAAAGFDATDWESGSQSRTILEIESTALSELWSTVSEIAKGMHLDTAIGGWLTLLAKSQYGLDRTPAEYTRGVVTFSLIPGGGPRTIQPGAVIVSDGLGHNFVTDNPAPVNLTTGSPTAAVPVIAQQTGADYNVATGTITVINQGPADITVNNIGIPLPAEVKAAPTLAPYNVNTFTLMYGYSNDGGTTITSHTYTFAANYATLANLVNVLNTDPTFSADLIASDNGGALDIKTILSGPSQYVVVFQTGTANTLLGFSTSSSTIGIGSFSTDTPARIYSASLQGPFTLSGLTLKLTVTVNGTTGSEQIFTFSGNYNDMNAVAAAIGSSFADVKVYVDTNRLVIETNKKGPGQGLSLSLSSTANPILGFSALLNTVAVGTSSWITQDGRDEESDDSLKARCRARWGILGAGTKDAFITWAREADPKVQKVVVYSNYLNGISKAGAVTVYIGGINTGLDPTTVINVYNYILAKMPIMSELYVGSVTVAQVFYTGTITLKSFANTPSVISSFKSNVQLYSQSLQIGDPVYKNRIISQILRTNNDGILDVTLTAPGANKTLVQRNQLAVIQEDPLDPIKYIVVS